MRDWDTPDDPDEERNVRTEVWAIGFLIAAGVLIVLQALIG